MWCAYVTNNFIYTNSVNFSVGIIMKLHIYPKRIMKIQIKKKKKKKEEGKKKETKKKKNNWPWGWLEWLNPHDHSL